MWIDYFNGMVLEKGDTVRAVPYVAKPSARNIVQCELTGLDKHGIWNALDLESEYDCGECYGDPREIKLTDEMILKVWRDDE
jgi:hypothetical protein